MNFADLNKSAVVKITKKVKTDIKSIFGVQFVNDVAIVEYLPEQQKALKESRGTWYDISEPYFPDKITGKTNHYECEESGCDYITTDKEKFVEHQIWHSDKKTGYNRKRGTEKNSEEIPGNTLVESNT